MLVTFVTVLGGHTLGGHTYFTADNFWIIITLNDVGLKSFIFFL